MTQTKHTPGPWTASKPSQVWQINAERNMPVALVVARHERGAALYDADETAANARLIAAAPDLLDACKVVTEFLDSLERNTDDVDPLMELRKAVHAPLRAALNPAIAKAEGRA